MLINGKDFNYKDVKIVLFGMELQPKPIEHTSEIGTVEFNIEIIDTSDDIEMINIDYFDIIRNHNKKKRVNFIVGLLTLLHLR